MMCSFFKYCNTAIYCNTLKGNTQYGNDPYCCIPNMRTFLSDDMYVTLMMNHSTVILDHLRIIMQNYTYARIKNLLCSLNFLCIHTYVHKFYQLSHTICCYGGFCGGLDFQGKSTETLECYAKRVEILLMNGCKGKYIGTWLY